MIIHIINLPKRIERKEQVIHQMKMEKCEYRFFDGVVGWIAKTNISKAHKSVVQYAKDNNLDKICIAEDDLQWTGTGAWQYFLGNIPDDYDIYAASYYSGSHDENFVVKGFRGMTLIIIHSRFFDQFLALPETLHIDGALAVSGAKIVVSPMFCAVQAIGFSDQRKRMVDDNRRLKNKPIYGQ